MAYSATSMWFEEKEKEREKKRQKLGHTNPVLKTEKYTCYAFGGMLCII